MLHSSTADPFKLALYKLMGKLEPSRRSVPQVTTTTEDWLWFQLAMVDEEEDGGLRALAEVLLGYGERHFDDPPNQPGSRRGVWAGVLLMCGQFERVGLLCFYIRQLPMFDLGRGGTLGIPRNRGGSCPSRNCVGVPWTPQSALAR
jgi:hypothetical protein